MSEADLEEDEDLKRAIALSLQDMGEPSATGEADESSETEDEGAGAPSKGQSGLSGRHSGLMTTGPQAEQIITLQRDTSPPQLSSQASSAAFSTLDRRQMEQERLARNAKREHSELDENVVVVAERPAPVKKPRLPDIKAAQKADIKVGNEDDPQDKIKTIKYPSGKIFKTYARHKPRDNDITIEEVLQKDELNTAIVSAYTFNLSWLFSKLNTKRTKLVLCMGAKGEEERRQWSQEAEHVGRGSIKIIWPPMEGEASLMHSKLMLLRYDRSLRIVVTSANVEMYDWGETGVMENSVFVIDLPERDDTQEQTENPLSGFGNDLLYFLKRSNFDRKILDGLLKFDFSATKDIGFVHSIGGASFGHDMQRTGFNSIARSIKQLSLEPVAGTTLHLSYITASLGALSDGLLKSLVDASAGKINNSMSTRSTKTSLPIPASIRRNISVIFPSGTTVNKSIAGPDNAGIICLSRDSYEKSTFPKDIMRDYESHRAGMLSHAKIILAYTTGAREPQQNKAWVFVGSHNFTESAWGKVAKDRARGEMKMVCRNWECGVIVPVSVVDRGVGAGQLHELFSQVMDVPCKVPGPEYGPTDEPWFFREK